MGLPAFFPRLAPGLHQSSSVTGLAYTHKDTRQLELLLWCNGISGVSSAPGCRSNPILAQWLKDLVLPRLWVKSQMLLRSDPWRLNSLCCGVANKEKKRKKKGKKKKDSRQLLSDSFLNIKEHSQEAPDIRREPPQGRV